MVHTPPRVSHDLRQQQEQDEVVYPPSFLHRQRRGNDWTNTSGLEAAFSNPSLPARRQERLPRFHSAFSDFERRDHGSPSTHLNALSLRDDDYYFEDLERARGSNVASGAAVPATAATAGQKRSSATPRQPYLQTPRHREREPDALITASTTHYLDGTLRSPRSKTALRFIMDQGEQPRSQLENADAVYPPNMLSHWDSRRRRTSPGTAARVEVYRAPYDPREEDEDEEKKQAICGSTGAAGYSSAQVHAPRPHTTVQVRVTHSTAIASHSLSGAVVEMAPPPPQLVPTRLNQTAVAAGKARPRVRPVPSAKNQEKRRARKCKVDGCPNYIINKGLCFRHGGGKRCSEDGCATSAKHAGKCWKHGGSLKCLVETCIRKGKTRGLCWSHGGGTKCSDASCPKVAVSNGLCWAHGGGKRCAFEGCSKAAYKRMHNYCVDHFELLKDGNVTLEV